MLCRQDRKKERMIGDMILDTKWLSGKTGKILHNNHFILIQPMKKISYIVHENIFNMKCKWFSVSSSYCFIDGIQWDSSMQPEEQVNKPPALTLLISSIHPVNKCNLSPQTAVSFLQPLPRHTGTNLSIKTRAFALRLSSLYHHGAK